MIPSTVMFSVEGFAMILLICCPYKYLDTLPTGLLKKESIGVKANNNPKGTAVAFAPVMLFDAIPIAPPSTMEQIHPNAIKSNTLTISIPVYPPKNRNGMAVIIVQTNIKLPTLSKYSTGFTFDIIRTFKVCFSLSSAIKAVAATIGEKIICMVPKIETKKLS